MAIRPRFCDMSTGAGGVVGATYLVISHWSLVIGKSPKGPTFLEKVPLGVSVIWDHDIR